jgi:hypothetical protein
LAEAEALQLRRLIGYHAAERPRHANFLQVLDQPRQRFIVQAHDVGAFRQRFGKRFFTLAYRVADDAVRFDIRQVRPCVNFSWPGLAGHSERRQDKSQADELALGF